MQFHNQIRKYQQSSYPSLFPRVNVKAMFSPLESSANVKRHFFRERQFTNCVTFFIWIYSIIFRYRTALTWSRNKEAKWKVKITEETHEASEKHSSLYGVSTRTDARARARTSNVARRLEPTREGAWLVADALVATAELIGSSISLRGKSSIWMYR